MPPNTSSATSTTSKQQSKRTTNRTSSSSYSSKIILLLQQCVFDPSIRTIQRWMYLLNKFTTINLNPTEENFHELPTVLLWIRFLLALMFGIFIGQKNERGVSHIVQTINLIIFLPVMYCRMYLNVPSKVFPMQVLFSGTVNAISLTMLIWIYYFTHHNATEKQMLTSMLLNVTSIPSTTGNYGDNNGFSASTNIADMASTTVTSGENNDEF